MRLGSTIAPSLVAIAVVAASLPAAEAAAAGQPNFCLRTARSAAKACDADARHDRLIAEGKCANLADSSAAKDCSKQAAADANDAHNNCSDENKARKDVCARLGPAPYAPVIDPNNFSHSTTIDNPFFPLPLGKTFVYEGQTAQGLERDEFAVTHVTRQILNITVVEVHDTVKLDGVLSEDTRDWFAQDDDGNVWYMGENSAEIVDGLPVDLSGSWRGGIDDGHPGIIMEANPMVGDFYRQEFLLSEAEDLAEVVSLDASDTVPFGHFDHMLDTAETSPLSPGDVEHKFYAKTVGNVLTIDELGQRSELKEIVDNGL